MVVSGVIIACFVLYFFLLSCVVILRPVFISTKKLCFFKTLFPSWKFYDDISHLPVLYYRAGSRNEILEMPWIQAIEKLDRNLNQIFLNPTGNLYHAYNSLLEQLENDKEEVHEINGQDLAHSVSYQLTKNLVIDRIKLQLADTVECFQFKLTLEMQGAKDDVVDTLLSPVFDGVSDDND